MRAEIRFFDIGRIVADAGETERTAQIGHALHCYVCPFTNR